jgi:hypothetical protein
MTVWLVTLRYSHENVIAPHVEIVSDLDSLESWRRVVATDPSCWPQWPWKNPLDRTNASPDPFVQLEHATSPMLGFVYEPSLVQAIHHHDSDDIVARYVFDQRYVQSHPEALEPEHLALLHGTIAAKLFDEGLLVLDRAGLCASLRWPGTTARGTVLCRDGSRTRR